MLDPNWKGNLQDGGGLSLYLQGMSLLYQSGVLQVLEAFGRPFIIADGKDLNVMATQAARSAGWFDALTALVNFREMYLDPPKQEMPKADFGGVEALLSEGAITEEEANAIRTGTAPDYSKYTASKTGGSTATPKPS